MTLNNSHGFGWAFVLAALVLGGAATSGHSPSSVPYPQGYRSWQHVRTIVVGPGHKSFARRGGIHHYYANEKAKEGYQTGTFPNGSIVVDEGITTKDGDGDTAGIQFEGPRRSLEVMVKDDRLYKDTGGWGFERFEGEGASGQLNDEQRAQCYQCHARRKDRDHVFTAIRP